jgi:hypothetical protein
MVDSKKADNTEQDYKKAKDYLDLHIKIEPAATINLEHIKAESNWDFFYNTQKMLSSKELDMLMDKIKTNRLPDMFFGYNRFYIANNKYNFLLEIDPIQMVDLCHFNERNSRFVDIKDPNAKINKESIYYIPNDIKVQFWDKWKNIKVDRNDIQKRDPTSDWTFTTAYMGGIAKLKSHKIFEENAEKFIAQYNIDFDGILIDSLEIKSSDEDLSEKKIEEKNQKVKYEDEFVRIELTNEELPLNKLGRDNPILHYTEVSLFDDELNDNGLAQGNFRYFYLIYCA